MDSKVSVIIPVYNAQKYIEQCIKSVIRQTYNSIELIIIDDGSSDNSSKVISPLLSIDRRIKLIHQQNSGPSVARNRGITESTGEYLVFIDSDDVIEETYIEKLFNKISKEKLDLVCCGYIEQSKYGEVKLNHFWKQKEYLDKNEFIEYVFNGVGGVLWGKIFRRDLIFEHNLRMNPKIHMSEDLIFVLEYSKCIKSIGVIDEYLYHYNRLNENSISSNITLSYLENYILVIQQIDSLLLNMSFNVNDRSRVINRRVRDIVYSINRSESYQFLTSGEIRLRVENIKKVISHPVILSYTNHFPIDNQFTKIMNYLVNKKKYFSIFIINLVLIYLQKIKDRVLRRV